VCDVCLLTVGKTVRIPVAETSYYTAVVCRVINHFYTTTTAKRYF